MKQTDDLTKKIVALAKKNKGIIVEPRWWVNQHMGLVNQMAEILGFGASKSEKDPRIHIARPSFQHQSCDLWKT